MTGPRDSSPRPRVVALGAAVAASLLLSACTPQKPAVPGPTLSANPTPAPAVAPAPAPGPASAPAPSSIPSAQTAPAPTPAPAPASRQQFLAVGDMAPDFSLPDQSGGVFNFADYKGKRNTLLFFHMGTG